MLSKCFLACAATLCAIVVALAIGETLLHDHDRPGREFMEKIGKEQARMRAAQIAAINASPLLVSYHSDGDDTLIALEMREQMYRDDECWIARAEDAFTRVPFPFSFGPMVVILLCLARKPAEQS